MGGVRARGAQGGGSRPKDPPLGWVSVVRAASRYAVAYALRLWLGGFFQGWKLLRLNFFHAKGLAPSGGHILSSSAKKEYGKKDAAQGGGTPPYEPTPWVGVGGAGGYVSTTRQICECIRAL